MPPTARPACPATGEQVERDPVPHLWRADEAIDGLAHLEDHSGCLMTRGNRVPLLLAGKEAPLECAEPARSYLDYDLLGTGYRIRFLTNLDTSGPGEHCNFHNASRSFRMAPASVAGVLLGLMVRPYTPERAGVGSPTRTLAQLDADRLLIQVFVNRIGSLTHTVAARLVRRPAHLEPRRVVVIDVHLAGL